MSNLRRSAGLKIVTGTAAVLLLVATVLLFLGTAVAVGGMYNATLEYAEKSVLVYMAHDEARAIYNAYLRGDDPVELYRQTNLRFRIRTGTGETLLASEDGEDFEIYASVNYGYYFYDDTFAPQMDLENTRVVEAGFSDDFSCEDRFAAAIAVTDWLYAWRYILPVLGIIGAILSVVFLGVFAWSSGYVRGREEPGNSWFEKIPFDLLLVIGGAAGILVWGIAFQGTLVWNCFCGLGCIFFDALLLLLLLRTAAVRLKTRTFWRTTVTGCVLYGVFRVCRRMLAWVGDMVRNIPDLWKSLLLIALNFFLDMFVGVASYPDQEIFLLFVLVKDAALAVLLLYTLLILRRIQNGGKRLANGQLGSKLDTAGMYGDFRIFAQDLNRIGDGMERAVQERLKSERLRTELITNVSHDIKTPLTSITSYVDLMKKENITEEPMHGYIEVLDRQSARLKKLTEDLIEASKAATGNVSVHLESCDASVLLMQVVGEYSARMKDAGLDPVISAEDQPVMIQADGRLLWRVLDNIMNNIVKYAMPTTRVYIDLMKYGDRAQLRFRNISREPLHGDAEDLLERFTRGDSSRSTEGSGLGLSIANSLTELQGGKLTLVTDGDLFKCILSMPLSDAAAS